MGNALSPVHSTTDNIPGLLVLNVPQVSHSLIDIWLQIFIILTNGML